MHSLKLVIIIPLLFIALAALSFGYVSLFQKGGAPLPESTSQQDQEPSVQGSSGLEAITPPFPEGTFSDSETARNIDIAIQKAENSKTAKLLWNENEFRVFHVVLLDADKIEKREDENILVWRISSLREFPEEGQPVRREDVTGFLSSGYVLGEETAGFEDLEVPEEFQPFTLELETDRTYYLQMIGFGSDDSEIMVNKTFTFTNSCLPPNCQ